MEAIVPIVLLGALGTKFLDLVKFLRNKDWNATVTQVAAFAVGVALAFIGGAAEVTQDFIIPGLDQTLADIDGWSKVLLGSEILALLGVVFDFKKSIDGTDSAKTPPLTTL